MKGIKLAGMVLVLGYLLIMASSASAYAIYNDSDHDVCITKWYNSDNCHVSVNAHTKYNGEHGAGLNDVWTNWNHNGYCYQSDEFSIPDGGYIKIYNKEVKIYNHKDQHQKTVPINRLDCRR